MSIRQPWAWLIVQGFKGIENRAWRTDYRGPVLIHAARRLDPRLPELRVVLFRRFGILLPAVFDLGGIVGEARIVDCVTASDDPWFEGPYGFVLADARPLRFVPCPGLPGLFNVSPQTLAAVRAASGGAT